MINSYMREVVIYLKEISLLISAPKSIVTLFTPETHQFQTHPNSTLEDALNSSVKKKQTAQNGALRMATGAHKMASIDHLHQESITLKVKDHSDMLSAQYLVNCLEEDHVCHGITT